MKRRSLLGFHSAMVVVYLGIFGAHMAHRDAIRDALLISSLAFCLIGAITCLAMMWVVTARKRSNRSGVPVAREVHALDPLDWPVRRCIFLEPAVLGALAEGSNHEPPQVRWQ